ncbi:gamma-glutamyl phosphate reductase [Desulfofarcimen acetoxidans DSM 771]|uniref:Gamma-glutamyl phosphate reductase n=1 Tax=Desulfofarcimen acetoxidans (strain ATCC 49208 / DSM 771 / KCTC 5769 / VKM B-1644 / 5575) TaxID=485916 RepID=C8VYG7_DESAS|nr:glutamate-5-semialdehyde dehydrogenase [Desulfofarcimen acetoxidans]ACV62848.1 gamma-glutamyl phosphate reductase [Desulfofarcimen acetoxidans DSM 771]
MRIKEIAAAAKKASIKLAAAETELKNKALQEIAINLGNCKDKIIVANKADLERSEKEGLALPLLKRLRFDESKIQDVIEGIQSLINLPDPVGQTLDSTEMDGGLELYKVSCPIGVIGVIFESRPDALVQISTLCLKSGNSVLLKGGSEARETNKTLAEIIVEAAEKAGLPPGWLQLLETRTDVNDMLKLDQYIDLIIPRGSNDFVRYIMDNSRIAVLGHADGICHCYVHKNADLDLAVKVVVDSKTQYAAACNTTETLLVDKEIAPQFLPLVKEALEEKHVELVGCSKTLSVIDITPASEEDWKTEYLDYKLSIRIVEQLDEAVEHINTYGSGHTDAIITENKNAVAAFMSLVDSGSVFWNCSTRFSDGFRYGLGAEVGISTNKIHARGPVGLEGLLIYKYLLAGSGQTVEEYANRVKRFTHKKLHKNFNL